jgi:hypothetical protein
MRKGLLLLFLDRGSSLGGLRLCHTLLEFIDATCRIDEFLLSGVKWMANVANADNDHGLRGARLNDVTARATDLRFHVLRMYICFHKRLQKIPPAAVMTSSKKQLFASI